MEQQISDFTNFVKDKALEVHKDNVNMHLYVLRRGKTEFTRVPAFVLSAENGYNMIYEVLKESVETSQIQAVGLSFEASMKKFSFEKPTTEKLSEEEKYEKAKKLSEEGVGITVNDIVCITIQAHNVDKVFVFYKDKSSLENITFQPMEEENLEKASFRGLFHGLFN